MRMACDAAGLVDKETEGSPKLDELAGLLDEICVQGGHKVVVFSEWERMQAMAAEVCDKLGIGHVRLHGGVPVGRARQAHRSLLRDDPDVQGLPLDRRGRRRAQPAGREPRGQPRPALEPGGAGAAHRAACTASARASAVNVVLLVSEDSFEEQLETTLDAKRALFAAAVGDDDDDHRGVALDAGVAHRHADGRRVRGRDGRAHRGRAAAPRRRPRTTSRRCARGSATRSSGWCACRTGGSSAWCAATAAPPADEGAVLLPAGAAAALAPLGRRVAALAGRGALPRRARRGAGSDPWRRGGRGSPRRSASSPPRARSSRRASAARRWGCCARRSRSACRAACAAGDPGEEPRGAAVGRLRGARSPRASLTRRGRARAGARGRAGARLRRLGERRRRRRWSPSWRARRATCWRGCGSGSRRRRARRPRG